jgi:hypothetical protein
MAGVGMVNPDRLTLSPEMIFFGRPAHHARLPSARPAILSEVGPAGRPANQPLPEPAT